LFAPQECQVSLHRSARAAAKLALLSMLPLATLSAGELGGSLRSVRRQHNVAKRNDYTFVRTSAELRELVRKGRLVQLYTTNNYVVDDVSYPYARPAVKLFIERLSAQYKAATGERLVITSLTRPLSRQPENASALSVHPAGMALDLRIPARRANRKWLEKTLLSLEDRAVLDVTRERHPPHYHVAVFPLQYERYVAQLTRDRTAN
jgi:hypothetical protein